MRLVGDAHQGDGLCHALAVIVVEAPKEAGVGLTAQRHQLGDGESAHGDAVGAHQADEPRPLALRHRGHVGTANGDVPAQRTARAGDGTQQCGLASTVLPQQGHQPATLDVQVQPTEHFNLLPPLGVAHGKVMCFEIGHWGMSDEL